MLVRSGQEPWRTIVEWGRKAAPQLRRLLPLKNRAEYDPVPIAGAEVRAAVTASARRVRIAEQTVKRIERCIQGPVRLRSASTPPMPAAGRTRSPGMRSRELW